VNTSSAGPVCQPLEGTSMLKTAPRSLLPAALLSALVGLAGCHISIGSGSSNPNGVHGKPAHHSPSRSSTHHSSKTSKPIPKKSTSTTKTTSDPEPTRDPSTDKTSEEPHRDQPDTTDPKRTVPTSDPARNPSDPTRKPTKHLGKTSNGGAAPDEPTDPADVGDAGGDDADAGGAGANTLGRPGRVVAPTKKDTGGANELGRPGSVTAPE